MLYFKKYRNEDFKHTMTIAKSFAIDTSIEHTFNKVS